MGWVRRVAPPSHVCEIPDGANPGDLWRCDRCRKLWKARLTRYYGTLTWDRAGWLTCVLHWEV